MSRRVARAKPVTLSRSEARAYEALCAWAARDDALVFLWRVLNTRPAIEGSEPQLWLVPSSSEPGEFHAVDICLRVCDCRGWRYKHHCSHLAVADRAAQLRFQLAGPAALSGDDAWVGDAELDCAGVGSAR